MDGLGPIPPVIIFLGLYKLTVISLKTDLTKLERDVFLRSRIFSIL